MIAGNIDQALSSPLLDGSINDDDHKHFALAPDVAEGYINGTEISAICGYRLVPSRNPVGMSLCPKCEFFVDLLRGTSAPDSH